jgi:hypothetical protein
LLRSPPSYNLAYLNGKAKQYIFDRYEKINLDPIYKGITLGYIKNNFERNSPGMIRGFVTRMDALDKLRGTDWRGTMPDVVDMLSSSYGPEIGL